MPRTVFFLASLYRSPHRASFSRSMNHALLWCVTMSSHSSSLQRAYARHYAELTISIYPRTAEFNNVYCKSKESCVIRKWRNNPQNATESGKNITNELHPHRPSLYISVYHIYRMYIFVLRVNDDRISALKATRGQILYWVINTTFNVCSTKTPSLIQTGVS